MKLLEVVIAPVYNYEGTVLEWLIFFGVLYFLFFLYDKFSSDSSDSSGTSTRRSPPPKRKPTGYRPRNKPPRKTIDFGTSPSPSPSSGTIKTEDLKDLKDAFTGAPLNPKLGLYKCNNCQVYYHKESYLILKSENNSKCMACGSSNIIAVIEVNTGARNARPDSVTLYNYKQNIGRVITFEGKVSVVRESRRGSDFAVMFENKSWTKGFKMVFFRGSIAKCGGERYIKSLSGKNIQVRGLLVNHERFGYEIIVSNPNQIKVI